MAPNQKLFAIGQAIFTEGDAARSLFLIQSGQVSIRKRCDGGEVEVAQATIHQLVGELAFFDRQNRSASAVAITEVSGVEISFDSLQPSFDQMPDYLKKFMTTLASRLRNADETIRNLKKDAGLLYTEQKDDRSEAEDILALTRKD